MKASEGCAGSGSGHLWSIADTISCKKIAYPAPFTVNSESVSISK